jgi:MoaA/NifB/PqqE/SkfB family radical SAM enzyme
MSCAAALRSFNMHDINDINSEKSKSIVDLVNFFHLANRARETFETLFDFECSFAKAAKKYKKENITNKNRWGYPHTWPQDFWEKREIHFNQKVAFEIAKMAIDAGYR